MKILRKIYLINNPNEPDGYKVQKLVDDQESFDKISADESSNPLKLLWSQTKCLFSGDHVRKTVLICFVQFLLYGSCHGLYMFFPEIVDKIEAFSKEFPNSNSTLCEMIVTEEKIEEEEFLEFTKQAVCVDKIEVGTFGHSLVLELLYMVGFLIITFLINRVTKLSILLAILLGCGASGVATLFVKIPIVTIYAYVTFMLTFLGVNIVCAATCSLYPTKLRGIAINVSMMFGRIGSVLSTFIVGLTLDANCEATFVTSAGLMLFCGFICIFIPQIRQIDGRK